MASLVTYFNPDRTAPFWLRVENTWIEQVTFLYHTAQALYQLS